MKKVLKVALLLSVLASCLLSCSHLFEDDVEIGNESRGGSSGGGVNRTTVDGREIDHAPNAFLKDVLKSAELTDGSGNIVDGKRPAGFTIIKPDGTSEYVKVDPNNGSYTGGNTIQIPVGTKINSKSKPAAGKQIITFTFDYGNGYKKTVPVEVSNNTTDASWTDIQRAAAESGIDLLPAGYTLKKLNGSDYTSGSNPALTSGGSDINIVLAKDIDYYINGQKVTVSVQYPETAATWDQIKAAAKAANVTIDESKMWKDGIGKLVSTSKKYPAGTSFTSSDSLNAATGGSAERVVTVDQPNRNPQIGDKLYKDPNGKGWIIAKADTSKDGQPGWDLLGYVYEVGGEIVKVVSKEIGDAKWARQTGAVYDGKSTTAGVDRLSKFLAASNATNGYDAWIGIGGDFEINSSDKVINKGNKAEVSSQADVETGTAWNPNALFRNYDAISWALCYPASNKTRGQLDTKHPLYKQNDTANILVYLQNKAGDNPKGLDAKSWTKEVVQIVTGNTVESRWYLPSVAELKNVYTAGPQLLNWGDLSGKNFWSVEVNTYTGDYDYAKEKEAKYVEFTNGTDSTIDKMTQNYKVLAIAQFNYTTM